MSAYNVLKEYHWVSKINSTPDIVRTTCIERLWGTMYILHLQSVVGSLMVNLTLCISHVNKNPQTGLQLSYHLDGICCLILINYGNSAELFLKQWNHMFFHANNQKFYIPHHQHIGLLHVCNYHLWTMHRKIWTVDKMMSSTSKPSHSILMA